MKSAEPPPSPTDAIEARLRRLRREHIFPDASAHAVSLGAEAVKGMLPHRPPLLFVDGIDAFDREGARILARASVDPGDPIFAGHFPGRPIYPGVLQLEMVGQAGLCLAWLLEHGPFDPTSAAPPLDARVTRVHGASFLAPVLPGDLLAITAERVIDDPLSGMIAGQVLRGGAICSTCALEVYLV